MDIQTGETERKIFRPMIHSPSEHNGLYYANPKPGASSRSPTWVQGPKALGHPRLPSRATGRELDGKRGCRDRTGTHMGSQVCKARTLTTAPLRWAQVSLCNTNKTKYFLRTSLKRYLFFIAKADLQEEGDTVRKIFCQLIHSPSGRKSQSADPEPSTSGSPMWVLGVQLTWLLATHPISPLGARPTPRKPGVNAPVCRTELP